MITKGNAALIGELLQEQGSAIGAQWQAQATEAGRLPMMRSAQLRGQCDAFMQALAVAVRDGGIEDIEQRAWAEVRTMLDEISKTFAAGGSSSLETATFIFSLKQPLFEMLRTRYADAPETLTGLSWEAGALLDRLGLYSLEIFQRSRDQIVARQRMELLELSTPVINLWQGILALPLVGTLDSARAQVVMENILQKIVDTGAAIAIIDITGVPMVDTLVAQHLMKTVAAARLMGTDCIISGIRPQIAQTIVHLGVDLHGVVTKATLADAFAVALERTGTHAVRIS